ncbi:MAG: VCBS repeat-containing protein [Geobacter sp.]|nr:VCBS repeat-containing protein [Geobacter sp.]
MKRLIMTILMLLVTVPAFSAAPLRVYVGEFNAVGVQAKDDTKVVLQSLLASRLSSDRLLAVSSAAESDVVVTGTYIAIGKQYNIDAIAKTAAGQTVARTFVQGEGGQDALFGASGKLAEQLTTDLLKQQEAGGIPRGAQLPVVLPVRPANSDIVRTAAPAPAGDLQHVVQGDIIKPQAFYRGAPNKGEVKRLDGMFNLLAMGGTDADGKRLLFIAQDRTVQLIREGESRPITGFGLGVNDKILSLDYVAPTGSSKPELYVTVVRGDEVASQVWELKNNKLVKLTDNIPYFFRAIALAGGPLKLYAQEQGRKADRYYGDVYEVVREGKKIIRKAKITMPRYGSVYGFNQIKHPSGELLTVVYHDENYLIVYDKDQKELWRSNDAFGGSELFYKVEDDAMVNPTTDKYRWFFMNQRILVTKQQEVLVGKNDGFFVIGNARMYKKGAVYSLYWNGAALEEVWRTKDTQNYIPDFWFDEAKSELLLLQLTQREDVLMRSKGASALQIKKVE